MLQIPFIHKDYSRADAQTPAICQKLENLVVLGFKSWLYYRNSHCPEPGFTATPMLYQEILVYVDVHGNFTVYMDVCGHSGVCGCTWKSMDLHGNPWISTYTRIVRPCTRVIFQCISMYTL